MIVHHLHHGRTACAMTGRHGTPAEWPGGHVWSANWQDVNCSDCLTRRDQPEAPPLSNVMTWTERHPHPGDPPPRPSDVHPTEAKALTEWWAARHAWDVYVMRLRRHEVAKALESNGAGVAEVIARNIGASWLDGTLL